MRPKHVAENKHSIVNHFVVTTANLTIYVWDTQQNAHCEDTISFLTMVLLIEVNCKLMCLQFIITLLFCSQ
jgi:hypothetical protein